jgi:hypothetical protein
MKEMEAACQQAATSTDNDPGNWDVYFSKRLTNCFFFVSDFVVAHGMTSAIGETDLLQAHRKLLNALGPISNELSEFTFGFASALFRKHLGNELVGTVVAKFSDAPNIDDLQLPFFMETSERDQRPDMVLPGP